MLELIYWLFGWHLWRQVIAYDKGGKVVYRFKPDPTLRPYFAVRKCSLCDRIEKRWLARWCDWETVAAGDGTCKES